MTTAYVGIDPGQSGAIAWLYGDGRHALRDMPETMHELKSWLLEDEAPYVAIEAQQAMPKQGVVSMFKLGQRYGELCGLMVGMGLPFEVVTPKRWQKEMGIPEGSDKKAHIAKAQNMFPDAKLCGPRGGFRDGRADALLIACWARRTNGGER